MLEVVSLITADRWLTRTPDPRSIGGDVGEGGKMSFSSAINDDFCSSSSAIVAKIVVAVMRKTRK